MKSERLLNGFLVLLVSFLFSCGDEKTLSLPTVAPPAHQQLARLTIRIPLKFRDNEGNLSSYPSGITKLKVDVDGENMGSVKPGSSTKLRVNTGVHSVLVGAASAPHSCFSNCTCTDRCSGSIRAIVPAEGLTTSVDVQCLGYGSGDGCP